VSIAKGSVGETRAQLVYALDFGYLKPETFSDLDQLGKAAAACLGGLNRHLNDSNSRGRKFKHREDSSPEREATEPLPLNTHTLETRNSPLNVEH
jgi:hypothetical protein